MFFPTHMSPKKTIKLFRRWSGEILRSYFAFFRNKKRLTSGSAVFLFVRCTCCRPIHTRRVGSSVIRRSSDSYLWALMAPAVFPAFPEKDSSGSLSQREHLDTHSGGAVRDSHPIVLFSLGGVLDPTQTTETDGILLRYGLSVPCRKGWPKT